jgi:large subunit ribosomal protein L21
VNKVRESSSLSIRNKFCKNNIFDYNLCRIYYKNYILIDTIMKYAIAQTSGKQFLVKPGEWYDIDYIRNGEVGDYIFLNKILFFRNNNKIQLGKPFLTDSKIPAKIIQQVKGKKITVLKTKPKKRYTRTRGHRQSYTRIKIDSL